MVYLEKEELARLLDVVRQRSERDWLMFLVAFHHGLRVSEVVGRRGLTAANIRDGYIHVDRLKGSDSSVHPLIASEKAAFEELARRTPKGPLFPISRIQAYRLIRKYSALAGIPQHKARFHIFKHSCCMLSLDAGMKLNEIQKYVGHKSLNSTAAYVKDSLNK